MLVGYSRMKYSGGWSKASIKYALAYPPGSAKHRQSELTTALLDLERTEEALVEQALAAGLECHRRPNADALALLGLEVVTGSSSSEEDADSLPTVGSEDAEVEAAE